MLTRTGFVIRPITRLSFGKVQLMPIPGNSFAGLQYAQLSNIPKMNSFQHNDNITFALLEQKVRMQEAEIQRLMSIVKIFEQEKQNEEQRQAKFDNIRHLLITAWVILLIYSLSKSKE